MSSCFLLLSLFQFGTEETCFRRAHGDGSVERGCTLDANVDNPNWCKDMSDCVECEGNGCNDENMYFSNCLNCDSISDPNCSNPLPESSEFYVTCVSTLLDDTTITARFEPYPFKKRGCYMNYKGLHK